MNKHILQNVSASVHQRLLNIARHTARPFDEVLQYFAMERFLFRFSRSPHVDSFVLKGALLFRVWDMPDSRATRDIDFLAYLDNSPSNLAAIVRDICALDDIDDGLKFDPDTVEAQRIKEDADYEGVRIRFRGRLGNARISMQMDVGFGDLIHPGAVQADYPALLDLPAPSLRMYPPETVIAEKAEAMVYLGSLNSRMKDFYDIWRMSQQFNFEGGVLCEAIRRTFQNRKTEIMKLDDLVEELLDNDNLDQQWTAFLQKSALIGPDTFSHVLASISVFLSPVFSSVKIGNNFGRKWTAPGPWLVDN
ncbi:MAG: nucleotidyl transferase AbiEii/AbiGii toxin family protein [Planctomycetota bacterium]